MTTNRAKYSVPSISARAASEFRRKRPQRSTSNEKSSPPAGSMVSRNWNGKSVPSVRAYGALADADAELVGHAHAAVQSIRNIQSDLCGQAHLFPQTPVERRLGNEAPKQTDLAGSPACGVAAARGHRGRGFTTALATSSGASPFFIAS